MALLILLGLFVLNPRNLAVGSGLIFGGCMVACSVCSYAYTTRVNIGDRRLWRLLDHAAIFLLIAGTYTPFIIGITGPLNLPLLVWTWDLAIGGITLRLIFRNGYERIFVGLYLLIGWLFLAAITDIIVAVNNMSLKFLAAGAVSYTLGAILFARDIGRWTDPIWHGFVLLGCYLHFLAVLVLVLDGHFLV